MSYPRPLNETEKAVLMRVFEMTGLRLELEVYYDTGAVMVWVDDGWLSNLETWWWSDDPPREFPPLETLRLTPPPD